MKKRHKYVEWKDYYITIFNSDDFYTLVFLNEKGNTKSVCYEDNFFYVECSIDTYLYMVEDTFKSYKHAELDEDDYNEISDYLKRYYKHVKRQCEVDLEALNEHTLEVLRRAK